MFPTNLNKMRKLLYHEKFEKRYLYLPRICRIDNVKLGKELTKDYHSKGANIFKDMFNIDQLKLQKKTEINNIQKDCLPIFLMEKKEIPLKFSHSKSFRPIVQSFLQNPKNLANAVEYQKYLLEKDNYNLRLLNEQKRQELNNADKKLQQHSFDEELYDIVIKHKEKYHKNNKKQKFGDDILEQMQKLNQPKTIEKKDSLLGNKKNVIDYRKRMAFRFRFSKYLNINKNLHKNNSEVMTMVREDSNPNANSYNTTNINNNKYSSVNTSLIYGSNVSTKANNSKIINNRRNLKVNNDNKKFLNSKSVMDIKAPIKLPMIRSNSNINNKLNEQENNNEDKLLLTGLKFNKKDKKRNSIILEENDKDNEKDTNENELLG